MRILHISASCSRAGGGISQFLWNLVIHQRPLGVCSSVASLWDNQPVDMPASRHPDSLYRGAVVGPAAFGFSPGLKRHVQAEASLAGVLHVHGLWMYPGILGRAVARNRGVPFVASPHGMLAAGALRFSPWRKRIALTAYEKRNLASAACLHATVDSELQSIREQGLRNPVAVVPIGFDMPSYGPGDGSEEIERAWPGLKDKKVVLFLSRVHPIKGLAHLARAWGRLCQQYPQWCLVIAGPDEDGHLGEIQRVLEKVGATGRTLFVGPVFGTRRRLLYAACDLFVLPSLSENFGLVVAEALASGKPVIATKGTPWQALEQHRCGWWIDIGVEPLEAALRQAFDLADEQRQAWGLRGRRLIEVSYSWPKIAAQMLGVYRWVAGDGPQPECVRLS